MRKRAWGGRSPEDEQRRWVMMSRKGGKGEEQSILLSAWVGREESKTVGCRLGYSSLPERG